MHIAIAGNIGSGKTTLATMLAKHYGWELQLEDMEDNPYISDFYDDMQRWSFNLQVFFLHKRFSAIKKLRDEKITVVQDRSIYEDAQIFAPNLHAMGLMSTRDFDNYMSLFNTLDAFLNQPDLMIYLRGSIPKLVDQIQKRGRDYEDSIRLDYLKRLNERYEAWAGAYKEKGGKIIYFNIDDLDFANNKEDASKVIETIQAEINGLF